MVCGLKWGSSTKKWSEASLERLASWVLDRKNRRRDLNERGVLFGGDGGRKSVVGASSRVGGCLAESFENNLT